MNEYLNVEKVKKWKASEDEKLDHLVWMYNASMNLVYSLLEHMKMSDMLESSGFKYLAGELGDVDVETKENEDK